MKTRTTLRCALFHRRWWSVLLQVIKGRYVRSVRCMWCTAQWKADLGPVPEMELDQMRQAMGQGQPAGADA